MTRSSAWGDYCVRVPQVIVGMAAPPDTALVLGLSCHLSACTTTPNITALGNMELDGRLRWTAFRLSAALRPHREAEVGAVYIEPQSREGSAWKDARPTMRARELIGRSRRAQAVGAQTPRALAARRRGKGSRCLVRSPGTTLGSLGSDRVRTPACAGRTAAMAPHADTMTSTMSSTHCLNCGDTTSHGGTGSLTWLAIVPSRRR